MKQAYPIILTPEKDGVFLVYVPDFKINTQGSTVEESIEMAMDAIAGVGMVREKENIPFPVPSTLQQITAEHPEEIVTLVLVDFTAYRRQNEQRIVRKNCSLPSWLNAEAEKAGLNFSALLQAAIKSELNIS